MKFDRNHRHELSPSRIASYLWGLLTNSDKNRLERDAMSDPFDSEALEGLSMLSGKEFEDDMEQLEQNLFPRRSRSLFPLLLRTASVLLLALVPSLILWYVLTLNPKKEIVSQELIQKNIQNEASEQNRETEEKKMEVQRALETKSTVRSPSSHRRFNDTKESQSLNLKSDEQLPTVKSAIPEEVILYEREDNDLVMIEPPVDTASLSVEIPVNVAPGGKDFSIYKVKKIESDQNNRFLGQVTDETGQPLPGVIVWIKGKDSSTMTNQEGFFSLSNDSNAQKLDVRLAFIGFEDQKQTLLPGKEEKIKMEPNNLALNEVVVVGYGTERENNVDMTYTSAQPVMGMKAYLDAIEARLTYPENVEGDKQIVVVKLFISKTGTIDKTEIIQSPGEDFSQQVLKVIKEGPLWSPALRGIEPVEDSVRVRIRFRRK